MPEFLNGIGPSLDQVSVEGVSALRLWHARGTKLGRPRDVSVANEDTNVFDDLGMADLGLRVRRRAWSNMKLRV